jgi:hypothetical protein
MTKTEVLEQYPHLPANIDPKTFLVHDPLFQEDQIDAIIFPPTDPDLVEAKRTEVLVTLNRLGTQIKNLRERLDFYKEFAACGEWTVLECAKLLRQQGSTAAGLEQIMIDRKVNQMDPDFSFSKDIWNEPLPSLCGRERPQ